MSLPSEDVATLDDYVRSAGLPSRSAAVQRAIRALRQEDLEQQYEAAYAEWESSGDRAAWDGVTGDGIG